MHRRPQPRGTGGAGPDRSRGGRRVPRAAPAQPSGYAASRLPDDYQPVPGEVRFTDVKAAFASEHYGRPIGYVETCMMTWHEYWETDWYCRVLKMVEGPSLRVASGDCWTNVGCHLDPYRVDGRRWGICP